MKKKIILFSAFGAISLFIVIFSIVMLATVSGENLLYTNVEFGSFCAKGYRWAILGLVIVTVTWLILGIKFGVPAIKKIAEKRKECAAYQQMAIAQQTVYQPEENAQIPFVTQTLSVPQAEPAVNRPKFCPFCGGKLEVDDEFCTQCGRKIPVHNS